MKKEDFAAYFFAISLLKSGHAATGDLKLYLFLPGVIPVTVAKHWTPFLGQGLSAFIASESSIVDDEMLTLLSLSPAASSLRIIHVARCFVTDASATVWARFTALEEVDISHLERLGMETLRSISTMPTIRSLKAVQLFGCDLTNEDFSELLAPGRMPLLQHVYLSFCNVADRSGLLELLGKRKGILKTISSHNKVYAQTYVAGWFEVVHQNFPDLEDYFWNWTADLGTENDRTVLQFLSNIRAGRDSKHSVSFQIRDYDDLLLIARSMPRLEALHVVAPPNGLRQKVDLSSFSCLKKLYIENLKIRSVDKWPPALISLTVKSPAADMDELDQPLLPSQRWLQDLLQLTQLEHFKFDWNSDDIDPSIVAKITSGLTNLRKLSLPCCPEETLATADIPLNNLPFLQSLSFPGPLFRLKGHSRIYLPSLDTLSGYPIPWSRSLPKHFPNAYKSDRIQFTDGKSEDSPYILALIRCSAQLTAVHDRLTNSPTIMFKLRRLSSLRFENPISEAKAALLLSGLPLLLEFMVKLGQEDQLPSCDWINHRMLQLLCLEHVNITPSDVGVLPSLEITPSNLPCLRNVTLLLERPIQVITIDSVVNLRYIYLRGSRRSAASSQIGANLVLRGCHFVRYLNLQKLQMSILDISDMDNLKDISLHDCSLPQSDEEIRLKLPRLFNSAFVRDSRFRYVQNDQDRLRAIIQASLDVSLSQVN